ncbi:hypothetical protein MRB53_003660 [Persea americana]|uniref:Uncharacterized protein n=1 Tax=Persea americana TaxID=3435 RepID=A0ACC2MXU3_PERAE|nr:hypothetical protein MRB53_003660 [Persea americana]
MVFDLQDLFIGKNTTAFPVVKRSEEATVIDFRTRVLDDAVTEGREKTSAQVGRAQGIYENSTLDGSSTHLAFSIIFNNTKYKTQGADRYLLILTVIVVSFTSYCFCFVNQRSCHQAVGEPLWYRRRHLTMD